jgi:hypothetical protein
MVQAVPSNFRRAMQITLNVPEQFLIDTEPVELARRIQFHAAVLMFQSGELSAGVAAELAGGGSLHRPG